MGRNYIKSRKNWQKCSKCKRKTRSLRKSKDDEIVCFNCSMNERHRIGGPINRKPHFTLKEALDRVYKVRTTKTVYKSGRFKGVAKLFPKIHVPQALIGHKVKLSLADDDDDNR